MQRQRFPICKGLKIYLYYCSFLEWLCNILRSTQTWMLGKAKRHNEKNTRVKRKCIRIFMLKLNGKWFQIHGAVGWFDCWRGRFKCDVTILKVCWVLWMEVNVEKQWNRNKFVYCEWRLRLIKFPLRKLQVIPNVMYKMKPYIIINFIHDVYYYH